MKQFERPPLNLCAQCGAPLKAPIWVEHLDGRHVRNLWSCEVCGYQFETSAYFPILDEKPGQAPLPSTALVH